jgi:N-acetylglutamate synthase-like GNAT family acetyltransferase
VELQVRDARITDVDRIATLLGATGADAGADPAAPNAVPNLLRQLVYLPNATVTVAVDGRRVVGCAVLALRPSVRQGGLVGTIDFLVVDPERGESGAAEALLDESLRSARNKGCVAVEAAQPEDAVERERLDHYGFRDAGPRVVRGIVRAAVA